LVPILVGNVGVRLNFYAPVWIEEFLNDDHSGGGADDGEEFSVDAAGALPVAGVGQEHARAVDVLDGGASVFECGGDDVQTLLGLLRNVAVVCTDGPCSGDVDVVADADGTGEADDGLVGRRTGNILTRM
jgi:hypothetical protein